ncbi:hypothetical protein [Allomesorhizobium alhagi]|uniref:Uncharacterized protein n=1 Tax=Mesorhizobium alhagi CCNWXJ12-2 TaxID=1107882 RepID=H0HNE4_9HYPH|nr:hypothetical protein [Mesorhizobium alhagi]EHK57716.1 hypothetical protein MAXJ12_08334 [Mesorhizobium alhagi CCNWXJ12-2]
MPRRKPFTNVQFARYAASIASRSASWARDILDDTEGSPRPEAVERFCQEIAGVLDRISEVSTGVEGQ